MPYIGSFRASAGGALLFFFEVLSDRLAYKERGGAGRYPADAAIQPMECIVFHHVPYTPIDLNTFK